MGSGIPHLGLTADQEYRIANSLNVIPMDEWRHLAEGEADRYLNNHPELERLEVERTTSRTRSPVVRHPDRDYSLATVFFFGGPFFLLFRQSGRSMLK